MLGIGLLAQGLRAAGLSRLVPVIMLVLLLGISVAGMALMSGSLSVADRLGEWQPAAQDVRDPS